MGARVSTIPQDPFNPNRFLSCDAGATDKQVRFDEDNSGSATLVDVPVAKRSVSVDNNDLAASMANSGRHSKWQRCSSWRGVASLTLAVIGAIALHSAFTSYHGTSSPSRLFGQQTHLPSATRLGILTFQLPFRTESDTRTAIVDTFLARALPIGRHDHALSTNGGKIFLPLTTPHDSLVSAHSLPADSILSDDVRLDGPWIFPGSHFQIGISFATTIIPTHFTIDYAFLPDAIGSSKAPCRIVVWGVVEGVGNKGRAARAIGDLADSDILNRTSPNLHHHKSFLPLVTSEYDIYGSSHVQTFSVRPSVVEANVDFGVIVLEVLDNWGGNETHLYRLRVHGLAKT